MAPRHSEQDMQQSVNLEFLLRHMKQCISGHQDCLKDFYGMPRDPSHKPKLPTRILSVGNNAEGYHLKLVEQRPDPESPRRGRYTALSHCWGPPETHSITTTTENIGRHCQNIPWHDLSKTFQDAVTITRQLGVEYLWIDSLCIVQNDRDDWKTEAPRMGFVYEEAYLTICATGAANGTEGCFAVAEDTKQVVPSKRETECPPDDTRWVYTKRALHNDILGPLQNRAWITQEWILSPRQIHYCRGRLAWCCDTLQEYDDGSPVTLILRNSYDVSMSSQLFDTFDSSELDFAELEPKTRHSSVILAWRWIVQEYMERDLTETKDKLAAMEGLIHKLQEHPDRKRAFPHGIMTEDLPYSIAWSRWERGQYLRRPEELRALRIPSWSWASILGKIDYTRAFCLDRDDAIYRQKYSYDPVLQALVIDHNDYAFKVKSLSVLARGPEHSILVDTCAVDDLQESCSDQEPEYLVIPIIVSHIEQAFHCLLAKPSKDRDGFYERLGMAWYVSYCWQPGDDLEEDPHEDETRMPPGWSTADTGDKIYLV